LSTLFPAFCAAALKVSSSTPKRDVRRVLRGRHEREFALSKPQKSPGVVLIKHLSAENFRRNTPHRAQYRGTEWRHDPFKHLFRTFGRAGRWQ
jgi:hypothetical protein